MRKPVALLCAASAIVAATGMFLAGCMKSNGPLAASGSGIPVDLAMSFSGASASGRPFFATDLNSADSIRVDSIIVVVDNIRFLTAPDSGTADTGNTNDHGGGNGDGGDHHGDGDHHGGGDDGALIVLRGPFVVHISDTLAVNFATQFIPAGSYRTVSFEVRPLMAGERHEDSDERHNGMTDLDTPVIGSSVAIFGAVKKDSGWTPFAFHSDLALEFRINGNFVVPESAGSVRFALNFNFSLLFRDPMTGTLLDPTDLSPANRERINQAIRFAIGQGRGGHDRDGDGHPDD